MHHRKISKFQGFVDAPEVSGLSFCLVGVAHVAVLMLEMSSSSGVPMTLSSSALATPFVRFPIDHLFDRLTLARCFPFDGLVRTCGSLLGTVAVVVGSSACPLVATVVTRFCVT